MTIEDHRVHDGFVRSRIVVRSAGSLVLVAVLVAALLSLAPSTSRGATSIVFSPRLLARVPSSKTVYLVTQSHCGTKRCLEMWRSSNRGASFVRRSAPLVTAANGDPASSLDQLVFANNNLGYLVIGPSAFKLYVTTNGARSWHEVTTLPRRNWHDLIVTGHSLYITTDRCKNHFVTCGDYRVWRSSTEGRHWSALPALWRTGTATNESYYGPSVAAYGEVVWEQETAPATTYLWVSHDYGQTFTRFTTPELGSVAGCSFTASTSLSMWAQCPSGMDVSFLHSSDNGIRWRVISQFEYSGTGGGDFDPVTGDLAYLDYGVSIRGANLVRLTDGGHHAVRVGELNCSNVSLAFTNDSDGLAICVRNGTSWALEHTSDGGAHWSNEVIYGD